MRISLDIICGDFHYRLPFCIIFDNRSAGWAVSFYQKNNFELLPAENAL
jgi:hypothetical protein